MSVYTRLMQEAIHRMADVLTLSRLTTHYLNQLETLLLSVGHVFDILDKFLQYFFSSL